MSDVIMSDFFHRRCFVFLTNKHAGLVSDVLFRYFHV